MTLEEIKAWLESNKGNTDVQNYLSGLSGVTLDKVKKFVTDNAEAKSWLDSQKDTHYNKALETWKNNNLTQLIDAEIKKKFPDKDPKEIEIQNLKDAMEKMRLDGVKKDLTTKALKLATDKKLPVELIDYFIGNDENVTTENITKLEAAFNKTVSTLVEEKLKGGYKPPAGDGKNIDPNSIGAKLAAQAAESIKVSAENNPYFK